MVYKFPFNIINWVKTVLLSGVMSVILGGIYMGIRSKYWDREWKQNPIFEQDNINDRLGFFHVLMAVGIWPMLLTMISEVWREKRSVTRDVEDGLYSKLAYIITKVFFFSVKLQATTLHFFKAQMISRNFQLIFFNKSIINDQANQLLMIMTTIYEIYTHNL